MHQSTTTISAVKQLYRDRGLPLSIRGKLFGLRELRIIHQCIEAHFDKGRTRISEIICEQLDWRQPNGWLKDRACRDVLSRLSEMGLVELPPLKTPPRSQRGTRDKARDRLQDYELEEPIVDFPQEIQLQFVKGSDAETLWNQLVRKYHYLGYSVSVGRTLKYLIRTPDRLLGAVSFSSASWNIGPRDEILTALGFPPGICHDIVINNTRFLILPCVTVKNLASRVLSLATARVVEDWTWYYSIVPQFVETFVDQSRFDGTCYKAANWTEIGTTKGYAKKGSLFHNGQEPKSIYIYGLSKRSRRLLSRYMNGKTSEV